MALFEQAFVALKAGLLVFFLHLITIRLTALAIEFLGPAIAVELSYEFHAYTLSYFTKDAAQ
jgi:hypothetical protein